MVSVMWGLAAALCLGVCWASWVWRLGLAHRGARVLASLSLTGWAWAMGGGSLLVLAGGCLVGAEFARAWAWPADFELWSCASGVSRGALGMAAFSQGWSLPWTVAGVGIAVGWWWIIARPIQSAAWEQGGARDMLSMVAVQLGAAVCVVGAVSSGSMLWLAVAGMVLIADTVDGRDRFVGVVPAGELLALVLTQCALLVAVWT